MEAPVHAVLAQELVVGAFLHDAALVEHGDPVGKADGRQAVRDEDDGPPLGEIGESLLHDVLALGVEVGGGLVQDEDRGILQERPREGDPLPLPPGELHAALPGEALVAVGHRDDEVVGVGGPGGALDLLRRRAHLAIGDVRLDRVVEQEGVLGDDRDLVPERGLRVAPNVDAIDEDPALRDVVEARDEVRQGRLAATAHSDERDHLAAPDGQADVLERHLAVLVAEPDVVELDRLTEIVQRERVRRVRDRRLEGEDLEDPLGGGRGLLGEVRDPGELAHGTVEHQGGRHEGEERAGRHGALDHAEAPVPEDAHQPEGRQNLHDGLGQLVDSAVLQRQLEQPAVDQIEPGLLVRLATEGLDDLGAGQRLLEDRVQRGDLLLRPAVDGVEPPAHGADREPDQGEGDQGEEREPRLLRQHDGEERDHGADLPERHDQNLGRQTGQAAGIDHDAGHEVGGVPALEERERHGLDVRVEVAPEGRDHPLADGGHHVRLAVPPHALDDVDPEDEEREELQHRQVAPDEDLVHGRLHEPGDEPVGAGDHDGQETPGDEPGPVGTDVRKEALEDAHGDSVRIL